MSTKSMRREGRRLVYLLLSLAAPLALMGCDRLEFSGYTKIHELLNNPSQYDGQEIKLRGQVVDLLKLPVLGTLYLVKDDSGEILVVTSATTPGIGSKVRLKGRFGVVAILGGQSVGPYVTESQRW